MPKASIAIPTNGNSANGDAGEADAVPKKRLNPIKRKQMEDRVHELEVKISLTEDEIARLETALQSFVSAEDSQRQSQELDLNKANHASLIREWESLSESLQQGE